MPKKILMVAGPVHSNPPLKGAAVETWMYEVSKRLVKYTPHIVSIAHPFYPMKEYRDGIFFHRIYFGRLYKRIFQKMTRFDPLSYPKRIAGIIDEVEPDIVHMHNFIRWQDPLVKAIRNRAIKTVLHMHNESIVIPETEVDAFVGCCEFIVDSYKKKSIKARNFTHIYNGVDPARFRPHREVSHLRDSVRSRFGIEKDEFVALYVGRISQEKGVEHFIQSALMLKNTKGVKFIVIGEMSKGGERGKYADAIVRMASPLEGRLTFAGVFPPSKIHLLYLLGDVIVLPSNFEEPFSMVAIEAMATGMPVIVSQKGGLKEYIIDGANGLFINREKPAEDIAAKVKLLMVDEVLRDDLGRAGRKTIEERFSWEQISLETEEFYSKLINGVLD